MRLRILASASLVSVALGGPASVLADSAGPPPPPKEAFDACSGAKEGDACTVHFGDHAVSGECVDFRGAGLACRPSRPPPPKEAFEACASSKEGDSCSVAFGPRTVSGTCVSSPGGLVCRPDEPPPPPR
jgi:hypothetical protein